MRLYADSTAWNPACPLHSFQYSYVCCLAFLITQSCLPLSLVRSATLGKIVTIRWCKCCRETNRVQDFC